MITALKRASLACAIALIAAVTSSADPRTDISLQVTCVTSYNSSTGLYTYDYTVVNQSGSANPLRTFGVAPVMYLISINNPTHWSGFLGWEDQDSSVVWSVTDNVGSASDTTTNQTSISPFCTQPGSAAPIFTIVSRQPPTAVQWYAQGADTMRFFDDDPCQPFCPCDSIWNCAEATLFGAFGVSGTTIGPDVHSPTGVAEDQGQLAGVLFTSVSPNPSGGHTQIGYSVPRRSKAVLEIFSVTGSLVRVLVSQDVSPGGHSVEWDGRDRTGRPASSGIYFARLTVGKTAIKARLALIR